MDFSPIGSSDCISQDTHSKSDLSWKRIGGLVDLASWFLHKKDPPGCHLQCLASSWTCFNCLLMTKSSPEVDLVEHPSQQV